MRKRSTTYFEFHHFVGWPNLMVPQVTAGYMQHGPRSSAVGWLAKIARSFTECASIVNVVATIGCGQIVVLARWPDRAPQRDQENFVGLPVVRPEQAYGRRRARFALPLRLRD